MVAPPAVNATPPPLDPTEAVICGDAAGPAVGVASALTFDAHPPRRHPHQRVEPVQRANHSRHHLRKAIPPFHVGKLVK